MRTQLENATHSPGSRKRTLSQPTTAAISARLQQATIQRALRAPQSLSCDDVSLRVDPEVSQRMRDEPGEA